MKKITYSNIYDTLNDVNNDVIKYLDSEKIKKTLYLNYKETINQYILYIEKNKFINLNNFNFD